jgi:hypothetical protein
MSRILVLIGLSACAVVAVAQSAQQYTARLTPLPLDVVNRVEITGSGSGHAMLEGRRLSVTGSFEGMQAPATVAHLHMGPALGIRGGPILDLTVDPAVAGRFSGSWELSAEQLAALEDGRLYIQIHSEIAPGGNLWGWLLE